MKQSHYSSKLYDILEGLERDLAQKKITKAEFQILLGLYIKREFSDLIQSEIVDMLPTTAKHPSQAKLLNYDWKRTLSYA